MGNAVATGIPDLEEKRRGIVRVRLQDDFLAFPIEDVAEVVKIATVTRLFRLPPHIQGVLNLRGEVCPVVNLARLLDLNHESGQRAVLVRSRKGPESGGDAAFLVDEVVNVQWLASEELAEIPRTIAKAKRPLFKGLLPGTPPTLLLVTERLFAQEFWQLG